LTPRKDPEVAKHNTSLCQQGTQAGKDGGVHLEINQDLGVTSVVKGNRSPNLSGRVDPEGLIVREGAYNCKAHTRETAMAYLTMSGKKGGDRMNLRAWNKPKMEGTAQAGAVLLRVYCTMRY
jgi:hypothetical protein